MKRALFGTGLLAVLTALTAACTIETNGTSTPNDPSNPSNPGADSGTDSATSPSGSLSFKPSNIDLTGVDLSQAQDWTADSANCTLHGESREIGCGNYDGLAYFQITQPDSSKLGVYVGRKIRIEPNAVVRFKGTYAVAIVALESFEILGSIDAGAQTSYASAGGFAPPGKEETKGLGPGGGGAGSPTNGGAGGSYCGLGGNGAANMNGMVAEPGVAYGSAAIVPLVGGSAGGTAALGNHSGTGGGAVQLVAGTSLRIAAGGSVTSGGGGGGFYGGASSQHGSGGGSGGAILIEAPTVEVLGIVAANGGGGGAKDNGKDGAAVETGAAGAPTTGGLGKGGDGSTFDDAKGGDGVWVDPDNAPGGGGGAGRIRINTTSGAATISGKLSPAATTTCATEGKLAAK